MKKPALIITIFIVNLFLVKAESYIVTDGKLFYRESANSEEISAPLWSTIPNENVYVRMHSKSKDNATFEIRDSRGTFFRRRAPKMWTDKTLKACVKEPEPEPEVVYVKTVNTLGGEEIESNHEPQFHYLCAFVNDFDEPQWRPLEYKEDVVFSMQDALKNLCKKQYQYARGRQYVLMPRNTTKEEIECRLDSILKRAGSKDLVLLYLSSHGVFDSFGKFHLIAKDSHQNSEKGTIEDSFSQEIINNYINLLTQKGASVLLFVDACFAGAILNSHSVHGSAAYYLSASDSHLAYAPKGGSVFVRALIDAINGTRNKENDRCYRDTITVGNLSTYLACVIQNNHLSKNQSPRFESHNFNDASTLWVNQVSLQKEGELFLNLKRTLTNKNTTSEQRAQVMVELGLEYLKIDGDQVTHSADSAFRWFSQALQEKSNRATRARAYIGLYRCYREGVSNRYGEQVEIPQKAIESLQHAVALKDREAKYLYGQCLIDGYYISQNFKQGIDLIESSASGRNGYPEAQWYMGYAYYQRAKIWRTNVRGEELKNAFYYGQVLGDVIVRYDKEGKGHYLITDGSIDYARIAADWFTKAAEQGYARAQHELGYMYYEGKVVEQDYAEAIKWFKQAAKQHYEYSEYILGKCYYEGCGGVVKNTQKGIELLRRAANQKHNGAIEYLSTLNISINNN